MDSPSPAFGVYPPLFALSLSSYRFVCRRLVWGKYEDRLNLSACLFDTGPLRRSFFFPAAPLSSLAETLDFITL